MKHTLEYLLLTQSPALVLLAAALLLYYLFQRKTKRLRAALALCFALLCLGGSIALYYLGMLYEHFTIHDFWHIRVPGWIGLGLVCALLAALLYRSAAKVIRIRRAEKLAAKAEKERIRELEDAKQAAYESGRADALAEETVIDTVSTAVASEAAPTTEAAPAAEENAPVQSPVS